MEREPAYVESEFLGFDSEDARRRCPDLAKRGANREVIVMADDGSLWQGAAAWVTCLWTLRRWRGWARRLAHPALLPIAAKFCHLLSSNRLTLSKLLRLKGDRELRKHVADRETENCGGSCVLPGVGGAGERRATWSY